MVETKKSIGNLRNLGRNKNNHIVISRDDRKRESSQKRLPYILGMGLGLGGVGIGG